MPQFEVVIYARFSPRPDASESESIEMQVECCQKFIAARPNYYKFAMAFEDREISGGRADNRPGLQLALDEVCKRKAILMCYSVSRLARNVKDALEIADRLERCGANLCLLDLQIDTTTPMGRCYLTIMGAFAELERRQIGQRTSDAMKRKQANGKRMSRHAPFGWKFGDADRLVPEPNEQAALEIIDKSGDAVLASERLNRMGLFTRQQKPWYPSEVARIGKRSLEAYRAQKVGV